MGIARDFALLLQQRTLRSALSGRQCARHFSLDGLVFACLS
jgi:hypothetical protein